MLLQVENLEVSYGKQVTVSNINLQLEAGEVLSIVGESGSGKTTVIRAIMGCLPHNGRVTVGNIYFSGNNLLHNTRDDWRHMYGSEMSMIFQDSGNMINPIRQIGNQFIDYIKNQSQNINNASAYNLACSMLAKMHLSNPENIMKSYPFELSGGMRQRVGIAMAMIFKPKLLLADEPTSALDVTTQAQIIKQLREIRKEYNVAIILVTHNLGVAANVSDKIIVMRQGKIVEAGSNEMIINKPQVEYTKQLLKSVPVIGGLCYYEK